ncbi:MAG: hypothetical protein M3Y28_12255, partial [Armatimonadota bacterium]|nr:hypothetical protein [Armatimonadota bacterium]
MNNRIISRVTLPMAEASQMEGRMKALLQKDRRRGGLARKKLALVGLAALGLLLPLAALRPTASAQTPGQQANFEVRHNGKLVMLIHANGNYDADTRTLHPAAMLLYPQGKMGRATLVDRIRFRDAPDGMTTVLIHEAFVNAQGFSAGSSDVRFDSLGVLRQIDALTPEQSAAIRNAVPDAPPRMVGPTKPLKRVVPPPQKYVAYNFTWAKVPGHPEKAEAQLKRIYGWLTTYRKLNGTYTENLSVLMEDMRSSPEDYGISEAEAKNLIVQFTNPDTRYTNMRTQGARMIPYIMQTTRLDGTALGSPKAPGTRDMLAYTDMYVQQNWRKGIPTTQIGFYLVLWDDGTVERVPWNAILWVPYVSEAQRQA